MRFARHSHGASRPRDFVVAEHGRQELLLRQSFLDVKEGRPTGYQKSTTAETVSQLCEQGRLVEAVEALGILVQTGCRTSRSLFFTVLQKCVVARHLALGRRVHALAVRKGFESDTFLCNHVMRMYASHARLQDAMDVFAAVDKADAFTWSGIISAHVRQGRDQEAVELYRRMWRSGVEPDGHVFVAALQACARGADLGTGQQVHADVLASGVEPDAFVLNALVDMYAKCGSLEDARRVFDGLAQKDVVAWSALIAGYAQHGMGLEALRLYSAMEEEGMVVANSVTFVSLLQACASVGAPGLEKGKQLHAQMRQRGLKVDVVIGSSLVNMYVKCGSLEDAQLVFDGLGEKNVVTWTALVAGYARSGSLEDARRMFENVPTKDGVIWNAMIAGYSQEGMGLEALHLYKAMVEEGVSVPDSVTFVCLLQACASLGPLALESGKQLHAQIRERGLQADVVVGGSLVNMYAKCGSLEDAQDLFDGLGEKDVVTWTALIAGYSQQGMCQRALCLYSAMGEEDIVPPDSVTFVCLLQACASMAALDVGRQLHAQIDDQGLQADATLGKSLIHMYSKSGSMVDAQQVFDVLQERDAVAWRALIAGYTRQGDSEQVFALLHRMREDGIQPDSITFLSVLTVCSHKGLVNKGHEYFDAMSKHYGIAPIVEHYTCMVALLGGVGHLDEALALVRTMRVLPNAAIWHTLLGVCRKWSNVEVGRHAFAEAVKLDENDAAAYVLMSNIYTGAQMWEQAEQMQARRIGIRAWKQPGQSWWTDVDGLVHSFLVGDTKYPDTIAIDMPG